MNKITHEIIAKDGTEAISINGLSTNSTFVCSKRAPLDNVDSDVSVTIYDSYLGRVKPERNKDFIFGYKYLTCLRVHESKIFEIDFGTQHLNDFEFANSSLHSTKAVICPDRWCLISDSKITLAYLSFPRACDTSISRCLFDNAHFVHIFDNKKKEYHGIFETCFSACVFDNKCFDGAEFKDCVFNCIRHRQWTEKGVPFHNCHFKNCIFKCNEVVGKSCFKDCTFVDCIFDDTFKKAGVFVGDNSFEVGAA